jgi:hypothetical protein
MRVQSRIVARLSVWQHALVLAAFVVLVCAFTYPLILAPGDLLPDHKDPLMYGWAMVSNVHRLLSSPLAVFHGNTFYPHGNVMAYTDLVLTPTLTAGPIYLLTGNPVLQYNLTLLVWWVLSGWAMYVLAFGLFRSHAGALLAAVGFTLCPFRTDFFLEFQMQLAFPVPLALLGLIRFLEKGRWPPLLATAFLLWVEALASMYYAIILGLVLAVVAGLHVLLRSGAWGWRKVGRSAIAGALLALALAPFLAPYVQNRRELGLERELNQPGRHSADLLTYFETGLTRLYDFSPSGHIAETSLFMGFVPLGLAAVGLASGPSPAQPRGRRHLRWALNVTSAAAGGLLAASLLQPVLPHGLGLRHPPPQALFDVLLVLLAARPVVEGWWARRDGVADGPLGERELRSVLVLLIVLFLDLSLGPHIRVGRQELGHGLYQTLYPYLLPLHAMRVTARIGLVVVLGVSLLAGLGMKRVTARLPGRRWALLASAAAVTVTLAEYWPAPLPYLRVDWRHPPPVYRVLAAAPEDVAVLEWPLGNEDWDDAFTFLSVTHWKRIVNGASGFEPELTHDVATVLSWPDSPAAPFPSAGARRYLLGIHPLRYVVVHNALIDEPERQKWARLRQAPWVEWVGNFADDDLYRLSGDTTGSTIVKLFSWDYGRGRTRAAFRARPLGPPVADRWLEVALDGRQLDRRPLPDGWSDVVVPVSGDRHRSAPNVIEIRWRYRRPESAERHAIGKTGGATPVDLHVASAGASLGDAAARASILVNGAEWAPNHRGYNLVAIQATTGDVLWSDVFDTHRSEVESQRLADALGRVPGGTIVVAAVRDEASQKLTDAAVAALRSIGGAGDIRGRYRVSHLVVGVKAAGPGTAIERSGMEPVEVTLGLPPDRVGVEIRDFSLR